MAEVAIDLAGRTSDAGEPGAIPGLMAIGASRHRGVSAAARSAIYRLYQLLPVQALSTLDDQIRRTWGDQQWYSFDPEHVDGIDLLTDADRVFLGLVGSHRNGYVRAAVLRAMVADGSAKLVPFAVLRLADWVDTVRSEAEAALRWWLRPEHSETIVECLELLDRVALSQRFRPECWGWVEALLSQEGCAGALEQGLSSPSVRLRRRCLSLAMKSPAFEVRELVGRALRDREPFIRRWAFGRAWEMPQENLNDLRELAARDGSGPIRLLAFEAFERDGAAQEKDFKGFLMDRSVVVRQAAQRLVQRRFGASSLTLYRKGLLDPSPKVVEVCIRGLAETGSREDGAAAMPLIAHPAGRVRRAVLKCLRGLGAAVASDTLSAMLSADVASVAREAATTMLANALVSPTMVWAMAKTNPDWRVRASVLGRVAGVGKWANLRLYLEAVIDDEPLVVQRGLAMLAQWIQRFNESARQPTAEEARDAVVLLESARDRVPAELFRQLSFISEKRPN